MNFLNDLLKKLTDVFNKNADSNIGKIFQIVSNQMNDMQSTLDTMEIWRDIDLAEGVVLDRIGYEILQEPRGGVSDEEYRLKIKTRIIVNYLSDGDIETIIKLLEVYLGDHVINVQTAANVNEGPFAGQPATLIITLKVHDEIIFVPFQEISRVLVGGVGAQWEYINERIFNLSMTPQTIMYPFDRFAGWLGPNGEEQTNDNSDILTNFSFTGKNEAILQVAYPICGTFVAGGVI